MNSWLSIWLNPRETIRDRLDSASPGTIFLFTSLLGFSFLLDNAQSQSLGDRYEIQHILVSSIFLGVIFGFLYWYMISRLVLWIGNLFNGHGIWQDVRAATLWASIPFIAKLGIWLVQILLFGKEAFTEVAPRVEGSLFLVILFDLLLILQFVLVVWYVVVLSKAVAEVHEFSGWKGFGVSVASYLILVIGLILLYIPFLLPLMG